jgi:uncharacterized protein (TIRG00374 family)
LGEANSKKVEQLMPVINYLAIRKSFLFMIVGLLVFILYLYFFAGFGKILDLLQTINQSQFVLFFSLTTVAMLLSMFFTSMAWYELLKTLSINISPRKAFIYNWVGNFVDLVIPCQTICGEIARMYLVYGEQKENFGKTVASVVSLRIISTVVILGVLLVGSVSIIYNSQINPVIFNVLVITLVLSVVQAVILLYVAIKAKAGKRLSKLLAKFAKMFAGKRFNTDNLQKRTEKNLAVFHEGFETLKRHPRHIIKPLIYSTLGWLFQMSVYFLVFYALGFRDIAFGLVVLVASITLYIQGLSAAFSVGIVEIIMATLYASSGIPTAIGGAATAMIRIMIFWFQVLVGFIIIQWIGAKKLLSSTPPPEVTSPDLSMSERETK